jgi:hypothetical protein
MLCKVVTAERFFLDVADDVVGCSLILMILPNEEKGKDRRPGRRIFTASLEKKGWVCRSSYRRDGPGHDF